MALVYDLVWRVLHVLLQLQRAALGWLRARALRRTGLLFWRRAAAAVLVPIVRGFTGSGTGTGSGSGTRMGRRARVCSDGKALEKVPQHVGLLIAEEEQHYTDIANVVVWCMALGISYISVYDHQGVFRRNDSRLMEEIVKQKKEFLSSEKGPKFASEFLNDGTDQTERALPYQTVVKVLSPDDGKLGIVRAAQRLCETVERRERAPDDITVTDLDSLLRESKDFPDPELVLKFGSVESTLGFLPWHIRLTEIVSLPSHKDVSYEDFHGALRCYAACEQRLGK
ncbi:dehydrodolichyl diphosphate synthase complex subunit nus1 [Trichomycterus rosablanca]|uniref:dehydrodolichyl diphosphate synthase complex subunit nus1 n=1 Tax=Trichomycterus rosablanca TaxID=2290929 RepID=UPI002F35D6B4